ncbi:serine/threonine kinase-like protein [Dermatophagoides farinae]|uniref:Serine/threonine kinase-like protein n=1 Tax=Dermatophagoides farinae TaxID=6954 RepID=A0A9D4P9P3_DERFA|nr:serine/threonine-protein kinase stk11-like [Dermatophagoides farinae]KAH7646527.1 serine/threonine kinase-like protein [Dermatophagoides farinae]
MPKTNNNDMFEKSNKFNSSKIATDSAFIDTTIKSFITSLSVKENSLDNKNIEKCPLEMKKTPINMDRVDNLDDIVLIGSSEEIYRLKVHKYKEIKNYIKGEILGRGKFGVVREFIDKKTLKRFAGKIIRFNILKRNTHLRHQINKELAITYHFNHTNVLRVYDIYSTGKKIYMFMEFCYGELAEYLKVYKQLPKSQCKDYFVQIIEGLGYLHSHGIIHRDIKPENILVTPDDIIKLADFGVCQEISTFTLDDMVFGSDGTPLYHPPELFHPKIIHYSGTKIDIWASGVVLYQMLVGELPFFNKPNTTKSDIDDILTKNVQYPLMIKQDVLLVDLFNGIFEKDFRRRMSIMAIKNHPWMQIDYNRKRNEQFAKLPTDNCTIDSYRGLTVLTRIYNKYYPPPADEKLVNFRQFQESCKILPLMRSSRYDQDTRQIDIMDGGKQDSLVKLELI